jgi:hypothetical protein
MMGLRHNPYVGTFHVKNFHVNTPEHSAIAASAKQFIMEDTKGNPLIGVFRHSPSAVPNKSIGLKSILYHDTSNAPVMSQLQVPREPKIPPHNILRSLRQIPTKVYTAPSVGSNSTQSVPSPNAIPPDSNAPTCSICLMPYADGDELRTFACSHCFHNECVSKWIFHRCLDNSDVDSFNCPECRQNHVALSEASSSRTSLAEGISSLSFLQVGENLARDCGYDFLSDFGSDLQSPNRGSTPGGAFSPRPAPRNPATTTAIAMGEDAELSPVAIDEVEDGGEGLTISTVAAAGSLPVSPRTRPPMPRSPVRRPPPQAPIPVGGSLFGPRMMMLTKTSNRLLGIFPVPEDSYCLPDSALHNATASRSSPTNATVGSDTLLHCPLAVSAMNTSAASSTGTTPRAARAVSSSVPPITASVASWSAGESLGFSAYSDCGAPLYR